MKCGNIEGLSLQTTNIGFNYLFYNLEKSYGNILPKIVILIIIDYCILGLKS